MSYYIKSIQLILKRIQIWKIGSYYDAYYYLLYPLPVTKHPNENKLLKVMCSLQIHF